MALGERIPGFGECIRRAFDLARSRMMVMPKYTAYHYDTAGNQEDICSGAAVLGRVVVNTGVAGQTVTVYNGATVATGTVVAIIAAASSGSYAFDADCPDGISVTLSHADLDVTVLAL